MMQNGTRKGKLRLGGRRDQKIQDLRLVGLRSGEAVIKAITR